MGMITKKHRDTEMLSLKQHHFEFDRDSLDINSIFFSVTFTHQTTVRSANMQHHLLIPDC